MNLLEETKDFIECCDKNINDIVFIGSSISNYSCVWDEFTILANKEYDNGFGSQEVCQDLVIIFNDNSWLSRSEYDGSESWEYNKCPKIPKKCKTIKNLFILNRIHDDLKDNQRGII
jgi:hypothetical protein